MHDVKQEGAAAMTQSDKHDRAVKLSEAACVALQRCASMFRAKIDHRIGIELEDDGLVRWHPGSGYEITESGRAALRSREGE